jgi:hypothetical protein
VTWVELHRPPAAMRGQPRKTAQIGGEPVGGCGKLRIAALRRCGMLCA